MQNITQEQIDQIFERAREQAEAVEMLYRLAFPDFDHIEKIEGHPQVSKTTNEYLFEKFIDFDRQHHPGVLPGGAWLNWGFGCGEVPDWKVDISGCKVEHKGVSLLQLQKRGDINENPIS